MARITVPPDLGGKLVKLCGMFGSDHEGERATAARLADQMVRGAGLTWESVFGLPPMLAPRLQPDIAPALDTAEKLKLDIMECVAEAVKMSRDQVAFLDHFRKRVFRGVEPTPAELDFFDKLYTYLFGVAR